MKASIWSRLKVSLGEWAIILAGLVTAQGLSALALIIVARRIPPLEFGQYLASYSLASLLVVLPAFGMDGWLLAQGATQPRVMQTLWWSAFRVRLGLLLVWLLAISVLALRLPSGTFPVSLLTLSACGLAADSLSSLAYTGLRNLRLHGRVAIFQAVGAVVLFCGVLILPFGRGQVTWFALFRAITSAALAAFVVRWMIASFGRTADPLPLRQVLQKASTFMVADVAVAIYLRADLTIVSFILGSSGASIYGPALNLANMCFLVPSALYFLVLPALAQAHRRSAGSFSRLGMIQLIGQVLSGLVLATVIFLLAEPIVRLIYGPEYVSSAAILRLLSPMLAIKSVNFGLGALLTSAGFQARRTTVQVLIATFNGCANLVAVSVWGVVGAAIVYILSEALLCAGYLLMVFKKIRYFVPEVIGVG